MHYSFLVFGYFSVVVLVIVNGQPTTEDLGKDEVTQLREELAKALARISKLEGKLYKSCSSYSHWYRNLSSWYGWGLNRPTFW